ncbi:unnamed protein product [Ambrosiozyma monospora]|uniref:Unnamed protein product n=1 Tax=Ambrosiozyma monospora TaxID=43982 RepID=A0ACB5T4K7_AMBMO|nr:unnamed protein product [Ambrosiozyma monospora]
MTVSKYKDSSSTPVASPSPSSPLPPPSDQLYKQAGALGVYSHYLLQNNPNNTVRLRSPLRSSNHSPSISESTIKQLRFNSNSPTPTPTKSNSSSNSAHTPINMPSLIPVQPTPSQPCSPELISNRAKTPLSSTSGFTTSNSTLLDEKAQLRLLSPRPAENEKEKQSLTQRIVVKSGNGSEKLASLVNSNASNLKLPKNFDVTFNTIKLLGGKDKLGKVVQYTLKILFIYSSKLRNSSYLSNYTSKDFIKTLSAVVTTAADPTSTAATSKQQPSSNLINLLLKILNNPKSFSVFLLSQFESRFAGLVSCLSIYRQMLRAGTIPFRLINLFKKLQSTISVLTNSKITTLAKSQLLKKQWWNIGTLDFAASLYYAWFDESLLMFKFGVLDKVNFANYYQKSVFHESFSWYLCILIELKQKIDKLRIVKAKEQSVLLGHEVKHKAKKLAAGLKSSEAQAGTTTVKSFQKWIMMKN